MKKQFTPYRTQAILKSLKQVFEGADMRYLTNDAYKFIINYCGFIAHYSLHGFRAYYGEKLDELVEQISTCNNDHREFDRYTRDKWFTQQYGEEYCKSITETGNQLVTLSMQYCEKLRTVQYARRRRAAKSQISSLQKQFDL